MHGRAEERGHQRVHRRSAPIEEISAHGATFIDPRDLYRQRADNNLWVCDGPHPICVPPG